MTIAHPNTPVSRALLRILRRNLKLEPAIT